MAPYAEPLPHEEIEHRLAELPGWSLADDGVSLQRTYRLPHLPGAVFVVHIAQIQDEVNHHSDLTLGYNSVGVTVTTHAAGGRLTAKDFDLARRIEDIAPAHGAA
ncbi:4a-hydroxytetrahydrobiopterin dehydratase [Streptomyces sp. NPDC046977]|uniref:4a-hydroxytetrahydrobiopterin dehydratase n=1 Tax=Streptomyces sp. NPDC046977 TaxID=3154703 RepID=UPI003405D264